MSFARIMVEFLGKKTFLMYSSICSMSVDEFIDFLKAFFDIEQHDIILFLVTQTFSCSIHGKLILNDICPFVGSLNDEFTSFFTIYYSKDAPSSSYSLNLFNTNGHCINILRFETSNPFNLSHCIPFLRYSLDITQGSVRLLDISLNEISEKDQYMKMFLNHAFLVADLSDLQIKKIQIRTNVISEFIDNQVKYCNLIDYVIDYLMPIIDKYQVLDQNLYDLFNSFFYTQSTLGKEYLSKCPKIQNINFFSRIGETLKQISSDIKAYKCYSDNYDVFYKSIKSGIAQNPSFAKELLLLSHNSMPFDSIISQPFQKIPKYREFTRRLLEYTPEGHIDRINIIIALENFSKNRLSMNYGVLDSTSIPDFQRILNNFRAAMNLEDMGFVKIYGIKYKADNLYLAVLATGILIINERGQLIFCNSPLEYSDICISIFEISMEMFFQLSHKLISFDFRFQLVRSQLFTDFLETIQCASERYWDNKTNEVPGLDWNLKSVGPKKLFCHSMAVLNDNIWIFGGYDENWMITNRFLSYSITSKEWKEFTPENIPPRTNSAMVSANGFIWIFGGSYYDEEYSDFWRFDGLNGLYHNDKTHLLLKGSGLSMIEANGESIILSGAYNNIFLIYVYNILDDKWSMISNSVPPILFHTSFYIEENLYIVFGEIDEKLNDSLYMVTNTDEPVTKSLNTNGIRPIPRVGQCAVYLKGFMWFFGGLWSSVPFFLSPTMKSVVYKNHNNYPQCLANSGAISVNDEFIYVYGGITNNGVSSNLYCINISHTDLLTLFE